MSVKEKSDMPDVREIQRFIQQHLYGAAATSDRKFEFILAQPGDNPTEVIVQKGPGQVQERFRKMPDGTIESVGDILRTEIRSNIFKDAWSEIADGENTRITRKLEEMLGLRDSHDWMNTNQEEENRNPGTQQLRKLLESRKVEKLASSTAKSIRNFLVGGQLRNPTAAGNAKLWGMMGGDNIALTLKVAGSHATWADFNICMKHRTEVEEAYRQNANATTFWFIEHNPKSGREITAENILEEAHDRFMVKMKRLLNIEPWPRQGPDHGYEEDDLEVYELPPGGPELKGTTPPGDDPEEEEPTQERTYENLPAPSPEEIWQAFCNLNHRSLQQYPPLDMSHMHLSILSAQAGAVPSHTVMAQFMRHPHRSQRNVPHYLMRAIMRESQARVQARKKNRTQGELAAKFQEIYRIGEEIQLDYTLEMKDISRHWHDLSETNPQASWEEWMEHAPERVKNAKLKKHLNWNRVRGEETSSKDRNHGPDEWNGILESALQFLRDHEGGRLREKLIADLKDAVTLDTDREIDGKIGRTNRMTLRVKGSPEPILEVTLTQRKTLQVRGSDQYWTGRIVVDERTGCSSLNSRGICRETARRTVEGALRENAQDLLCELPPKRVPNMVNHITERFMETVPPEIREGLSDKALSEQMRLALLDMFDPEKVRAAQDASGHKENSRSDRDSDHRPPVTVERYNLQMEGTEILEAIKETNPGALEWLLSTGDLDGLEPLNHPGQIIAQARASMQRWGLSKSNWKNLARTTQRSMRTILGNFEQQHAAVILDAMAQRDHRGGADTFELLANRGKHLIERNLEEIEDFPGLAEKNTRRMISLIDEGMARTQWYRDLPADARRGPKMREPNQEINNISDYVQATSAAGQEVKATTWNGLLKATEAWHRRLRERAMERQWQEILSESGGTYLCWNSLVDTRQADELTITALTTEYDLYRESEALQHCVIRYGPNCAQGESRIFRISKGESHLGTGEIVLEGNTWTQRQTQGRRNHPLGQETREAMENIAEAYTEAWQEKKSRKSNHTSWRVRAEQISEGEKQTKQGLQALEPAAD